MINDGTIYSAPVQLDRQSLAIDTVGNELLGGFIDEQTAVTRLTEADYTPISAQRQVDRWLGRRYDRAPEESSGSDPEQAQQS